MRQSLLSQDRNTILHTLTILIELLPQRIHKRSRILHQGPMKGKLDQALSTPLCRVLVQYKFIHLDPYTLAILIPIHGICSKVNIRKFSLRNDSQMMQQRNQPTHERLIQRSHMIFVPLNELVHHGRLLRIHGVQQLLKEIPDWFRAFKDLLLQLLLRMLNLESIVDRQYIFLLNVLGIELTVVLQSIQFLFFFILFDFGPQRLNARIRAMDWFVLWIKHSTNMGTHSCFG